MRKIFAFLAGSAGRLGGRRVANLLLAAGVAGAGAAEHSVLWEIGKADGDSAELALAPKDYARFGDDPVFLAGVSRPKADWPYVQPGPDDAWAGRRQHTFAVRFGLAEPPPAGACRLELDLLDTHASAPPRLRIEVNGHAAERALPRGAGDASILGQPKQGRPRRLVVEFPAGQLHAGDNDLRITTLSGSWLLYDALRLLAPAGTRPAPVRNGAVLVSTRIGRTLRRAPDGKLVQDLIATVRRSGPAESAPVTVAVEGGPSREVTLSGGKQEVRLALPEVEKPTPRHVTLRRDGQVLARRAVTQKPVRHLTIYVLPHSHTDIGYTEPQPAIEEKQVNNLLRGIELARATADYPEGARFVWNVEVLWAADLYQRRLGPEQRRAFLDAVRRGQVALNGLYLNELTGLCREEELLRLCQSATRLGRETGVPVDAAMISDVPGYTWATVTALAQAGIRYFSVAPNFFDRIGDILVQWENKPFYWVGPSGRDKVLVWIPWRGYAMSLIVHRLTPKLVTEYQDQLEQSGYPYDISYMRWAGHGDNATPDPAICEFIREWNATHAWPRFIIASTSTAFRAFEERYGDQLPEVAGDWTPYWEDGAGSSAYETGLNRASSDRLVQAETLWALRQPHPYPAEDFADAWRDVLLYSEHTWGAWCSVTEPHRKETLEQWAIKHDYAAAADRASRELLVRAAAPLGGAPVPNAMDLFNTTSWPRTELVTAPRDFWAGRQRVLDDRGQPVPSQRLANGDLVLLARGLPPFGARRYTFVDGQPHPGKARASAEGATLRNGRLTVRVDEQTGALVELRAGEAGPNLVDTAGGQALNDYLYFTGADATAWRRNGPVRIRVKERGPLVASLLIESDAPGCRRLTREVRLVAGQDFVELINLVDKERIPGTNYGNPASKESLNFAFPFAVPGGVLRLGLPLAVMRPDRDQIPGSCKNWFTVGRWADVSNDRLGVTWATLDAPLVQVGGLTANLLNSQTKPSVWRHEVEPARRFYSWAMNNHWGTNYRAYQEGPVRFRYLLRVHGGYDPAAASRWAIGRSQPPLPVRARGPAPDGTPRLSLSAPEILVTGLKPADRGTAWIVRLWNASDREAATEVRWRDPQPRRVFLSGTGEDRRQPAGAQVTVPARGVVTLRAEMPGKTSS